MEDKIKECIESIEKLGADIRYEENKDRLIMLFDSIEFWAKKGSRLVQKMEEEK